MHGHRVDSRTREISDAEHSVLDSLPLVSPLGFHFRKSQDAPAEWDSSSRAVMTGLPLQSVRRTPEEGIEGVQSFLGK